MSATYEELLRGMLGRVTNDVDKREGSVIYDALAPCAYFLAQQNFQMDHFVDLVFADTAVDEYLDRIVTSFGVERKPASAAIRVVKTSEPVPVGSRWGINGLVYTVTGMLGDNLYEGECGTAGEIGNRYSGSMDPVSGVENITAELTGIITAGADRETDDALRNRFYQKVRYPATSGNAYHYKLWALEVPGVGDARVYPLEDGPGTLTVLIVDSNKTIDASLEAAVAEHIEEMRPIGASVTVGSPEAVHIDVTAEIILDGTLPREKVEADFKSALEAYVRGLVFADYRVSFAVIGSLLLATEGVKDYNHLQLNETLGNIIIPDKAVPVMGAVSLSEVISRGTD